MTASSEAPLEDLMVAMDVVDTARHRELIVDRELDAVARRKRLLERLREIYSAQGIDVTDAALEAGVDALEQERFRYTPTPDSFSAKLARLYVRRNRWMKPVVVLVALGLLVWLGWYFSVGLPEQRQRAALPNAVEQTYSRIAGMARSGDATQRAMQLRDSARSAIRNGEHSSAEDQLQQMQALLKDLELTYDIRIVSRPNELSGVWARARRQPGCEKLLPDRGGNFPFR